MHVSVPEIGISQNGLLSGDEPLQLDTGQVAQCDSLLTLCLDRM